MRFLDVEKERLTEWKVTTRWLSQAARADGEYRRIARRFCLPHPCAIENLFPPIQQRAVNYFCQKRIRWHDGVGGMPSNHLCGGQVCCVNFLLPFSKEPGALLQLFRQLSPSFTKPLPMDEGQLVSFEWIGMHNYLNERLRRGGVRTRGANFTSADAAVLFQRRDGSRQVVLIEWKYTEQYAGSFLGVAKSHTDRREIYRPLFDREDCPINKALLPSFDALFYEPFYQFMRQQFLAHEMQRVHEFGASEVTVLHLSPAANRDFRRITSPSLSGFGTSATEVWKRLLRGPGQFVAMSIEDFFNQVLSHPPAELGAWRDYITERYAWVTSRP